MVLVSIPQYPTYNSVWSVGQGTPIYNDSIVSLGYQAYPDVSLINNLNGLQGYYFSNKQNKRKTRKTRTSIKKVKKSIKKVKKNY